MFVLSSIPRPIDKFVSVSSQIQFDKDNFLPSNQGFGHSLCSSKCELDPQTYVGHMTTCHFSEAEIKYLLAAHDKVPTCI